MGIVSWISNDGEWVELDLPRGARAQLAERGRVAFYSPDEPQRERGEVARRHIDLEIAFVEARQRAIRERQDELVSRRPGLKALRGSA